MFTFQAPDQPGVTALVFVANLGLASLVSCGGALALVRVVRSKALPLRHALLLTGLAVAVMSPALLGVVQSLDASLIGVTMAKTADDVRSVPAAPLSAAPMERGLAASADVSRGEVALSGVGPGRPAQSTRDEAWRSEAGSPPSESRQPRGATRATSDKATGARPVVLWIGYTLVAAWIAGSLFQLLRLYAGWRQVQRLVGSARPVGDERILKIVAAAARSLGLARRPSLGQSASVAAPMSAGLLRARILLPAEAGEWSDGELRSLLLHEMAHLRRRDLEIGLLQRVAAAMYWWNPFTRKASSELAEVREQICDDIATLHGSTGDGYARLLVELAAKVAAPRLPLPALGAADGSPHELARRVRRLLDPHRRLATSINRPGKIVVVATALVLIGGVTAASMHVAEAEVAAGAAAESSAGDASADNGADGAASETGATTASDATPIGDLAQKRIRVVDDAGKPIAGVTVTAAGYSTTSGAGGSWEGTKGIARPAAEVTDERGLVELSFSTRLPFSFLGSISSLWCTLSHPDYAQSVYNVVPVSGDELERTTPITLARGGQVDLTAVVEGRALPVEDLFPLWSGPGPTGFRGPRPAPFGAVRLPRLPAGPRLIRLAYLPKNGAPMFSDVQAMDLVDGENHRASLRMRLAVRVEGRLDDSVPRPVKNGRVVASVIYREPGRPALGTLSWRAWAKVVEDGSFVFPALPAGPLQVAALCDGFYAAPGEPPAFVPETERTLGVNRPQVFEIAGESSQITVGMQPTGDCTVKVLDPEGRPVVGVPVAFSPNVAWWDGSSGLYCHPLYGTLEELAGVRIEEAMIDGAPFQAKTDATGTASVKNLPVGRHYFSINDNNWRLPLFDGKYPASVREVKADSDNEFVVTVAPQGSSLIAGPPSIEQADSLSLGKPSPAREFPTRAEETELAGAVVDEQGQPLAGVEVDAWTWHPGNETVTDAEGRFRMGGFERRMEVEIEFTKEGYSPSLYAAIRAGTDNWTVVLTQGTWIEGQVLDPTGGPAAGALVRAWRGPFENEHGVIGEVWTETRSAADGAYRLHLEPDEYHVQVRLPGIGAVRHDNVTLANKEKKQLDLKLDKGVTFRAAVRDSVTGDPVVGIVLWNWRQPGIEGTSDADGVIEIAGMMPGEFEFGVSAAGGDRRTSWVAGDYARWWSESAMHAHQRAGGADRHRFQRNFDDLTFNLQGETVDVEVIVERAVTITGRVLDPDGNPVAGATVAPAKTGTGNSLTGDTRFSYTTDAEGRYTMKLPASHGFPYNLIVHDGAYGEWRQWANGIAAPIQTTPGQRIENVDLLLTRPGTVRGRVLDAGGDPRRHVEVRAARVDQHDNRYYMPTTKSDEDGRYELRFVSPGKHRIQIQKDGRFWLDPDQAPFDTTRTVTVKAGETVEDVDFMAD